MTFARRVALVLVAIAARGQNAVKIVDQYISAAGGAKALARIQTLHIEGTFTGADGRPGTFAFYTKLPNRYYTELAAGGKSLVEAYNGRSAWREDGAVATCIGLESRQLEAAGQYYNTRPLNPRTNKLALAGRAQVRGQDAWQIEVTAANGVKRQVYFDAATHLIVEERATFGGMEQAMLYDDYRTVAGVKLPHRIELHRGGDTFRIAVTRADVNGDVGEGVFDFPTRSQARLPDLKALFRKIEDNQRAIQKIKENYTGTRTEEESDYDGNGRVKKVATSQYTFFYLDGEEVSTLVAKDGQPLSDEQQRKENERARKRVEELQKREARKEASDNDAPGIGVFLRACRFVNPRRERYRGQDALVFDFEPNPEFKPRRLAERLAQRLAGVVWVDEKALSVARLEAYLVGDMTIAGGLLARVQKGTRLVLEQGFINNEAWLPTYAEAQGGVRLLMLKGFTIQEVTRYSDYKKFNVETRSVVGKAR